jgi:DNA-binding NarL/FixJ family response regulator
LSNPIRVLVVDDDPTWRASVETFIQELIRKHNEIDLDDQYIDNLRAGRTGIREGDWDLVMVDLGFPGEKIHEDEYQPMNGLEGICLVRTANARRLETGRPSHIMVVTQHSADIIAEREAIAAGADIVLGKDRSSHYMACQICDSLKLIPPTDDSKHEGSLSRDSSLELQDLCARIVWPVWRNISGYSTRVRFNKLSLLKCVRKSATF